MSTCKHSGWLLHCQAHVCQCIYLCKCICCNSCLQRLKPANRQISLQPGLGWHWDPCCWATPQSSSSWDRRHPCSRRQWGPNTHIHARAVWTAADLSFPDQSPRRRSTLWEQNSNAHHILTSTLPGTTLGCSIKLSRFLKPRLWITWKSAASRTLRFSGKRPFCRKSASDPWSLPEKTKGPEHIWPVSIHSACPRALVQYPAVA